MTELETLNRSPGVETNAMVLFLAINTSSVALLPTKVIAIRAEAGSADAIGVVAPTLVATRFDSGGSALPHHRRHGSGEC